MGKTTTEKMLAHVDEIKCVEEIDVEGKKPERSILIRGELCNGNRFRINFKGDFEIVYKIQDKKTKEITEAFRG